MFWAKDQKLQVLNYKKYITKGEKNMNVNKYLKKDEQVTYKATTSAVPIIVCGIFAVLFIAMGIIYIAFSQKMNPPAIFFYSFPLAILFVILTIYNFAYFISTGIYITDKRVIMCYGLLKSVFSEIPLDKVSGLTISESVFGKIFGYGNVIVESSAAISGVKLKYIKKPFDLKKNLPEQ